MEQGHDREHVGRVPMITLFGCAGLAIILLGAFWAYTKEFFLALNRSPRESEGARALYTFSVLAGAYSLALSHATSEIKDVSFWLTSVALPLNAIWGFGVFQPQIIDRFYVRPGRIINYWISFIGAFSLASFGYCTFVLWKETEDVLGKVNFMEFILDCICSVFTLCQVGFCVFQLCTD